ncbi:hypothetical protein [Armatimonas sp.]|uniref:hypothetical protein n=1 Tax=Armatimonas sp. TaxID=1872638 RepID=UPI00286BD0A9|nr:hypothetical protein [Armatimonas sp.]
MAPEALKIEEAIALIARVPGYAPIAQNLARRTVRYVPTLEDRGQATLLGVILIGPEALQGSLVGLAETLVHEEFHTRQNHFLKTYSFWSGVFTRTPVMARYERPAYQAALDFLSALAAVSPEHSDEALAEYDMVQASFSAFYGARP